MQNRGITLNNRQYQYSSSNKNIFSLENKNLFKNLVNSLIYQTPMLL